MNKSEAINELSTALAKAQGEIKGAIKDATNPFFKSAYADLASVWEAIREPLAKNGLAVIQTTDSNIEFDRTVLVTTLAHSSGQWISGSYVLKPKVDDPQGMGSAMSYARRYCLAAIIGVYQTDDDGNLASQKKADTVPGKSSRVPSGMPSELKKPDPRLADKSGDHDHAWKPSQYKGEAGQEMEYCITCKLKRVIQNPNEPEFPFDEKIQF